MSSHSKYNEKTTMIPHVSEIPFKGSNFNYSFNQCNIIKITLLKLNTF